MWILAAAIAAAQTFGGQASPQAWSHSFYSGDAGENVTDYQRGMEALDERHWQQAILAFAEVIRRRGSASDGALYWTAYAENRTGDPQAALRTIEKLKHTQPRSGWLSDARALQVEIKAALGRTTETPKDADVNVKLLELSNLISAKPQIAVPALRNIVESSNTFQIKDRALFVLAQSSTAEAQQALGSIVRHNVDPTVRAHAVRYVGLLGGEAGRNELVSLYRTGGQVDTNDSMKPASLEDLNAEARTSILQALVTRGDAETLIELEREERDPKRKAEIAHYLSLLKSNEPKPYRIQLK